MGMGKIELRKDIIQSNDMFQILNTIMKVIASSKDIQKCITDIITFSHELFYHSSNVAFLSLLMGMNYYDDIEDVINLFIAAFLHDYGKIYIPLSVLSKPDILTCDERKIIEFHPMLGYFYLKRKTYLPNKVLLSIRDHHEKVDGTGYGLRKKGSEISEYARIISIADVFDAMATDRVYRSKLPKEEIYNFLFENEDKHFDREILRIFMNQMDEYTAPGMLEELQGEFHKVLRTINHLTDKRK